MIHLMHGEPKSAAPGLDENAPLDWFFRYVRHIVHDPSGKPGCLAFETINSRPRASRDFQATNLIPSPQLIPFRIRSTMELSQS